MNCPFNYRVVWNAGSVDLLYCKYSIFTVQLDNSGGSGTSSQYKYTIIIVYLLYGHFPTSKRTVAGSIPDSSIFRKRFTPSRRKFSKRTTMRAGASKTRFPVLFVASVINLKLYLSLFDLKLQLRAQLRASASPRP